MKSNNKVYCDHTPTDCVTVYSNNDGAIFLQTITEDTGESIRLSEESINDLIALLQRYRAAHFLPLKKALEGEREETFVADDIPF